MGGRGAASAGNGTYSWKGELHHYGDEYRTIMQDGDVKFIMQKASGSGATPMETQTKGRIYAFIGKLDDKTAYGLKYITLYDDNGVKAVQIDMAHDHGLGKSHAHNGPYHGKRRHLDPAETAIVDSILRTWDANKHSVNIIEKIHSIVGDGDVTIL
ncbi:MAG: hypothetical protein IKO55_01920 [Kiritimatiellae bacterium]|nr:hypothetical protein [Kiritimatiellia bacterium]